MRAATIRGRLLFLSQSSRCGYYSGCGFYSNKYGMRICIVGTGNGYGYDDKQKCTICGACRPYHSILGVLKPVFRWIWRICNAYNSLRCLDHQIWRFLCPQRRRQNYFTTCACTWGNQIWQFPCPQTLTNQVFNQLFSLSSYAICWWLHNIA